MVFVTDLAAFVEPAEEKSGLLQCNLTQTNVNTAEQLSCRNEFALTQNQNYKKYIANDNRSWIINVEMNCFSGHSVKNKSTPQLQYSTTKRAWWPVCTDIQKEDFAYAFSSLLHDGPLEHNDNQSVLESHWTAD